MNMYGKKKTCTSSKSYVSFKHHRKIYAYEHLCIFKASYLSHLSIQCKFAQSAALLAQIQQVIICILKPELWSHNFLPFTRRARYHWRELKPSNLRLPTLECCGSLCGLDCDLWGATTLLFSYKCVHHYVAFASFPLVSKACLCVLLSLSFFSSPLKTWKDSCKSLRLCFSWIKVVFLSPIFMISLGWYRYRQQILCCWRNPCMSLIVV